LLLILLKCVAAGVLFRYAVIRHNGSNYILD
jgi:hypothetical protein